MPIRRHGSFLCRIIVGALALACAVAGHAHAIEGPPGLTMSEGTGGLLGEGIDFRGGMLDWEEDEDGNRVAILRNYAVVLLPQLTISARNMVLNVEMQEIYAEGEVLFEETGGNAFYADQLTFNYQEWKGLAKNIRIKMDRQDVDLPVRDILDARPSTSMSSARSLNDAGEEDLSGRRLGGTTGATGQLKRMYVQASELRAHDQQTLELIDAKITPSGFARPHWHFHSPAALYRQKEKIESYHNTVRVGRWPVLYFPYLIRDLQYDWPWMRLAAGRTGDFGFFLRSQWGWRVEENPDAYFRTNKVILDLDIFSRRGMGVGLETTYKAGYLDSLGKLKVYGVWEFLTSRSRDEKRAFNDNEDRIYQNIRGFKPSSYRNDFRWAVDWEHYQQLNELWDVRAEAHLYHDRDYLQEYDSDRFWNAKEPENSLSLRRQDKQWQLEFVASSRLSNKWMEQSDYLPEARLTVPGMQMGDLPLYFKNDLRVGVVNRRFDEDEYNYMHWSRYTRPGMVTPPGFAEGGLFALDPITGRSTSRLHDKNSYGNMFRAVNDMRIEAPISLANAVTLKPWVGLRTAYYSRTQGEVYSRDQLISRYGAGSDVVNNYDMGVYHPHMRSKNGSGDYNFAMPFGADLSTRFYTIFGASDQWRLITEPVLSWTENSKPHLDYLRDVYTIDYYDRYQRQRKIGFELHNKLQRRYFELSDGASVPERDILDFNIAFSQYPRGRDRHEVNDDRRYTDLSTDIIYRPIEHLAISGSMDYDIDDGTANRAIVSVDWRINNYLRTYVTHFYYRGHYWAYPDKDASSQTHLALRTKLWNDSSHYSLEGAVAYEWRNSDEWKTDRDGVRHGFNKYRVTLFRDMDTMELALSYVRDRNGDDHGVFFSLTPKSFMGYDSPPPGYSMEIEDLADGRYSRAQRFVDEGYLIDGPVQDADIKDVQF
ncbi:MAG: hypothetical protein LUE17_14430 [Planctomycetaceae bacterium]|nr:hypothetical protein [Planctomycetaceae bacterium]